MYDKLSKTNRKRTQRDYNLGFISLVSEVEQGHVQTSPKTLWYPRQKSTPKAQAMKKPRSTETPAQTIKACRGASKEYHEMIDVFESSTERDFK